MRKHGYACLCASGHCDISMQCFEITQACPGLQAPMHTSLSPSSASSFVCSLVICKCVSSVCKSGGFVLYFNCSLTVCVLFTVDNVSVTTVYYELSMTSGSSTSLTFVLFSDKCLPLNTKSSQLFNSLQSLRPQPSYPRLPLSHAGRVPQGGTVQ